MTIDDQVKSAEKMFLRIPNIAKNILKTGSIRGYLDMCIMLDYLEYYNQLFVYIQYPNARLLASFSSWIPYTHEKKSVLKKPSENSIKVLIPFRLGTKPEDYKLAFVPVELYDISQTTISEFRMPLTSYVPNHEKHSEFLVHALSAIISNEFFKRVVYDLPKKGGFDRSNFAGTVTKYTVTVKGDLSNFEKITWLIEAMLDIYYQKIRKEHYTDELESLFILSVCYMLMKRLYIPHHEVYLPNAALLKSLPESLQVEYFELIQKAYRKFENAIHATYHYYRFGTELDLDDIDIFP